MNHRFLVSLFSSALLAVSALAQSPGATPVPQNPAPKPATAPSSAEQAQAVKLMKEAATLRSEAEKKHHEAIDLQVKAAADNQRAEADFRRANALEAEALRLLHDQNKQAAAGLRNQAHDLQRRANQLAAEEQQHRHRANELREGGAEMQKAIHELADGGRANADETKTLEKSMAETKADETAELATATRLEGDVKKLRGEAEALLAKANQLDPQGKETHAPLAPHKQPSKQ